MMSPTVMMGFLVSFRDPCQFSNADGGQPTLLLLRRLPATGQKQRDSKHLSNAFWRNEGWANTDNNDNNDKRTTAVKLHRERSDKETSDNC
jgi:hypothetical protein